MPKFPPLDHTKPILDPTNQAIVAKRRTLAEGILATRAAHNANREKELEFLGARVLERFWITNSVLLELPSAAVDALAARADVVFIQPDETTIKPPTTREGRQVISSDYLFDLTAGHLNYWFIGLLDTGMPVSADNQIMHTLFNPGGQIGAFDCVNGTNYDCTIGYNLNPADDCWNHGISSAGILTANSNMGDDYRGATRFTVWGYKVYTQNGTGPDCGTGHGLSTRAAERGFQAAIVHGIDVIVAEIQDYQGSVLTTSADNAFDAGVAVIAAAGNSGPAASTVRSPGEAHKAIAVGAVDYQTLAQEDYQSRGPTADGRIKPDIQAPTWTQTASNQGWTAIRSFGGTSGSTPYGGAAAALLGYWLNPYGIAPGYVYAQLINAGLNFSDPTTNNTTGTGLLSLVSGSTESWSGMVTINNGQTIELNLPISGSGSPHDLRASIWWPESQGQTHNDIDAYLVDPWGIVRSSSLSILSVFEKVRYSSGMGAGTWKLRIHGYSVSSSQEVYYAAYVKTSTW